MIFEQAVTILEACQAGCIETPDINARFLAVHLQAVKFRLEANVLHIIPGAPGARLSAIDLISSRGMRTVSYGEADFIFGASLSGRQAASVGGGMVFTEIRKQPELEQTYGGKALLYGSEGGLWEMGAANAADTAASPRPIPLTDRGFCIPCLQQPLFLFLSVRYSSSDTAEHHKSSMKSGPPASSHRFVLH